MYDYAQERYKGLLCQPNIAVIEIDLRLSTFTAPEEDKMKETAVKLYPRVS